MIETEKANVLNVEDKGKAFLERKALLPSPSAKDRDPLLVKQPLRSLASDLIDSDDGYQSSAFSTPSSDEHTPFGQGNQSHGKWMSRRNLEAILTASPGGSSVSSPGVGSSQSPFPFSPMTPCTPGGTELHHSTKNLYIRGLESYHSEETLTELASKFSKEEESQLAVDELVKKGFDASLARVCDTGSTNLYFQHIPLDWTENNLNHHLRAHGQIMSSRILRSQDNVSKGVGFARMASRPQAEAAIAGLNGKVFVQGQPFQFSVNQKRLKEERKLRDIKHQRMAAEAALSRQMTAYSGMASAAPMHMSLPVSPATPMYTTYNPYYSPALHHSNGLWHPSPQEMNKAREIGENINQEQPISTPIVIKKKK